MSSSGDPRKDFLARTIIDFFSSNRENLTKSIDDMHMELCSDTCMDKFLSDASPFPLQASLKKVSSNQLDIILSNEIGISKANAEPIVCFTKIDTTVPVTAENIHRIVSISSMSQSAVRSLYSSLHNIFVPMLSKDGEMDPRLKGLMQDLEAGLGTLMRGAFGDDRSGSKTSLEGILTLEDEVSYWREIYKSTSSEAIRTKAKFLQRHVDELIETLKLHEESPYEKMMSEGLQTVQDVVDRMWKMEELQDLEEMKDLSFLYQEARMERVLMLIGDAVIRFIQVRFGAFADDKNIWKLAFQEAHNELSGATDLCRSWLAITEELTGTFWDGWKGDTFRDSRIEKLEKRLIQISDVRATHDALQRLLSKEELRGLELESVFSHFSGIKTLQVDAYSDAAWLSCMSKYEALMHPTEDQIIAKLRGELESNLLPGVNAAISDQADRINRTQKTSKSAPAQPYQLMQTFSKYRLLLARPTIENRLALERDKLLSMLITYVVQAQKEMENQDTVDQSLNSQGGKNLAGIVNTIVSISQLLFKLEQTVMAASPLIANLKDVAKFEEQSSNVKSYLTQLKQKNFDDWKKGIIPALNDADDPIALQTNSKLMSFDQKEGGRLQVHYSERLVTLLREARQLAAIGCKIPPEVDKAVDTAHKFFRDAMVLKQVAALYNSIGDQILDSQKPMLIEEAVAFEKVVLNPKKTSDGKHISWNTPGLLKEYIEDLQSAMDRLNSRNRRLRKAHKQLSDIAIRLMNTDLVRQRDKWKDGLQQMRRVMDDVESEGFTNTRSWRVHWDYQLYKALEYQYKVGLESCHETLQQIDAKLIFKQKKLVYEPSYEELRSIYFRELKRFISIPFSFKGVGESDIFKSITDRNSDGLSVVFLQAEKLFRKLSDTLDKYMPWVALGSVDLDVCVEENLREVEDWEANFRMLKTRVRDVDKLPDSERVDCITVDASGVKAAAEELLKSFGDALAFSLRKSAQADIDSLELFVKDSLEALSVMPQTIEEIAKSTSRLKEICEKMDIEKRDIKVKMEEKGRLLKNQTGTSPDTSALSKLWDDLELRLSAHEKNAEEQRDRLKGMMEQRIKDFKAETEKFAARWRGSKPDASDLKDRSVAAAILEEVHGWEKDYQEIRQTSESIKKECQHFDVPVPVFSDLESLDSDVQKTVASWSMYDKFSGEMGSLAQQDWLSMRERLYVMEDFLAKWSESLRGLDIDVVVRFLLTEVERLRKNIPFLKFVKGDAFTKDHWKQLLVLLEMPKDVTQPQLTLQHFLDASDLVVKKLDAIKDLQARATAELTMQEAMDELIKWGAEAVFTVVEQKDSSGRMIMLIKEWKEVQTHVGDHQSVLQAMRDSPYFSSFAKQAEDWDRKLSTLAFGLNDLNAVQRKWLYLEPIFGRGALPHEQGRFKKVDEEFRNIMNQVRMDQRVVALAEFPGLNDKLPSLIDQLDRCQKALSDFLEEKRSRFPRFYFIGDDDLLEILGQSQNATVIQSHLKKLFQAIFAVNIPEDTKQIDAFRSLEGEVVDLRDPVVITDTVEVWLAKLSEAMVATLEVSLDECSKTKDLDINAFPSMILCTSEQICFCAQVELAIKNRTSLKSLESSLRSKLSNFTSINQDALVLQLKLKAIVLDLIHDIDVVNQLIDNKVTEVSEWYWQKQLRYYMDNKRCVVRMCDAQNAYTYEYQGNDPKLVHTPLTDKCYLTLTQGLHLGYGGNPYGPAGTGKTESVKALGQALARQVLVFNCDEGIDYKSMGRIFTGLVKCGAWGCFDEFNRLEPEVLSAVSQQIQVIQAALKEKSTQVHLLGKIIDVNKNSGIFVTLNPAGKGYGGRSELPDNLKQLFRSVAMAAPDNALIAEVILYAEGYAHAKIVGTKVVELFTLSKQLLSKQQHYDWGLRALKTILLISGKLVQMEKKVNTGIDIKIEMELVIKAVRLNTLAKLTNTDMVRFEALIKDIFPGTEVKDAVYMDLETAIRDSLGELKLDPLPSQIKKVVQLNENLNQRMGCVIVGPSGCGKSTLLRILRAAHAKMKQQIVIHTMNPKAMPRQQLLGHMDLDTREWFDGVLTASARQVVKEPPEVRSWIICDGDIDPEWVESLNSVLDDNRLLTMPSGERIRFGPNVNFIFETSDLRFASPATVSRMGMIFLSDEDMQTSCLVRAWISRAPDSLQERLTTWLNLAFDKALDWVINSKTAVVETTRVGVVLNALSHLLAVECKEQFACALARGMGSNLDPDSRAKLASEIWQWCNESPLAVGRPLDCYFDKEKGSLVEYTADLSTDLSYQDMTMSSPTERDLPVIQTIDLFKNLDLFTPWLENNEPFLLVGPEGCGKSMLLRYAFTVKLRTVEVATINCNAQTSAIHVIQKLQQSCTIATSGNGRVYRPKSERLVLYLKDINLPKPDKYDTMQLIAFLQQLILYQGFYDGLEWMGIERVQIVCSMNPSSTVGRHNLTTRFTAIVRIASISYPPREQLQQVYTAYLNAVLRSRLPTHALWSDRKNMERLAGTLLDFYSLFNSEFSVDAHRHYLVTPRDVSRLVVGLLRYDIRSHNVLELLTYEAQRIFRDRLVGAESSQRFDSQVWGSIIRSQWKEKTEALDVVYSTWLYATAEGKEDQEDAKVKMLGRSTLVELKEYVAHGLMLYEREYKELKMLLFPEIVERVSRLDRILSEPGGSALLVGRPGVGRRTCVTLACFMHSMEVFTPKVGRGYQTKNFLNDLKAAVQVAGVQGKPACLFIEDYQLVEPSFLEIINSLLSSGEVPGMFTNQELDALLLPLKEEYSSVGYKFRSPYAFFVNRVQMHLHIIISLDPTHHDFLLRCESNPALYSRCCILWLDAWSKEGMSLVPTMLLEKTLKDMQDADGLVHGMHMLHKSCLDRGAAPLHYVTLLDTIASIYEKKRSHLEQQRSFLGSGLSKLKEAADIVDTLSREAIIQQKQLSEKQSQADRAMQEITINMEGAGKKKQEAQELSNSLASAEEDLHAKREVVKTQLDECLPGLEAAKQAVGNIKKDNLNEIRSFKLPPEPIRDVLEGVLRLMNNQDTSWLSMKRFLSQTSVIHDIMHYDAHNITPDVREGVRKLLAQKSASFQHDNIYRVSVAAAPLAAWVKAQIDYSLVLDKIAPLTNELTKVDKSLGAARLRLQECADAIKHSDEIVGKLTVEFQQLTQEAGSLKVGLQRAMETLESAQNLIAKLAEEKDRWGMQMSELDQQLHQLPRNILMASGFITYLGQAPEDVRANAVKGWCESLQMKERFNLMLMMSTESERLTWKAQGLPGDDLSAENAVVIFNTKQYPLIIDPATQATSWLLNYHSALGTPVEVTTQQETKFMQKLELAVRFGKTLVIQEVDKIEALLFPILRKDLQRQGPRWCVAIGEKMIDFSENFRLFLVTRNPMMEIPPDAHPLVAHVNFSVTRSGLEGQLLGRTIQHEKPELERQKSDLLAAEEAMKVRLSTLEKQLLEQLASSQGNILENKALIQALTDTKVSSQEIKNALANSYQVQVKLDNERDAYRGFARSAANVYFLVQTLKAINYMYQFDLPTYLHLFNNTLSTNGSSDDVSQRLSFLVTTLKRNIFNYVGRSLFKADRLTFGMHLVRGMNPDMFKDAEWDFFVGLVIADTSSAAFPIPEWVPPDRGPALQRLAASMPSLVQGLSLNDSGPWSQWVESPKPEVSTEFPPKASGLRAFQKMLVVQALRADRLQSAMEGFVCDALGERSINLSTLNLGQIATDVTPTTPILFIVTPGSDPSAILEQTAVQVLGDNRYRQLAMGQGQSEAALKMLQEGAQEGHWVCLQNVHLVVSWLGILEKELRGLTPSPSFRLWLTTEPHPKFPPILLQQSLKITFEAPPGLKKNLQNAYSMWSAQYIAKGSTSRAQLLFLVAWFHAVVQERRTFIPQGWSKFHEFSFADLRSTAAIVGESDTDNPPWETLHGLLDNAIYGGRIDNIFDQRILRTCLRLYYNSQNVSSGGKQPLPYSRICVPMTSSHADYIKVISTLSDVDTPALFGLPLNIERVVQQANSARITSQLKTMATADVAKGGWDKELMKQQLQPLLQLWQTLTSGSSVLKPVKASSKVMEQPVDAFVLMEAESAHALVASVNKTLEAISRVLRGVELLSEFVRITSRSLAAGLVPDKWSDVWEGPESPALWLQAVVSKTSAIDLWLQAVERGAALASPISLSSMFNPSVFLNALRQQTARHSHVAVDDLKLVCSWSEGSRTVLGAQPVTITGTVVQGALFTGGYLTEAKLETPTVSPLPSFAIGYISQGQEDPNPDSTSVSLPVYEGLDRSKLLTQLRVPCKAKEQDKWILCGAAIFVSTE